MLIFGSYLGLLSFIQQYERSPDIQPSKQSQKAQLAQISQNRFDIQNSEINNRVIYTIQFCCEYPLIYQKLNSENRAIRHKYRELSWNENT